MFDQYIPQAHTYGFPSVTHSYSLVVCVCARVCVCVCLFVYQDKEEADYVDWLKGQSELDGKEEVQDMVSVCVGMTAQ